MMDDIILSIQGGLFGIVCAGLILLFWSHFKKLSYKAKKICERKLYLQGLEYTLKEIYELLKKHLEYSRLSVIEFEEEQDRIKILCKNSTQFLSLDNGELILKGETKGGSLTELIDTECLMISIAECLEFPVEESSRLCLRKRKFDQWAFNGLGICIVLIAVIGYFSETQSLVKKVQGIYFTQYSSTVTVGEALQNSCTDTKWEEGTYGDNKCVRFTGYTKEIGMPMYVIFEVEKNSAEIVEIGWGGDSYNDSFMIHLVMGAMYNYGAGTTINENTLTSNETENKYAESKITEQEEREENEYENDAEEYEDDIEPYEDDIEEYINTSDISSYLDTLYSIYDKNEIINLYMNDAGYFCSENKNTETNEEYYSQVYETYMIENGVLYGYAGDIADEFDFWEDGHVEVLLDGAGSTHYQSYVRDVAYFNE